MVHKRPKPKGTAQGKGLFMGLNTCLLYFICYILHCDWSLLLLVNTHGSFHFEKMYKVVYTVNKKQGSL